MLRQLVAMGHLRADSEAFGALKLTETARGVLKGETEVMLREQVGRRNRAAQDEITARRYRAAASPAGRSRRSGAGRRAQGVAFRGARARAACRPMSCCTMPPSTASPPSRPTTLDELRGIPGIGDKKLEHYGDELIALVKAAG